MDDNDHGNENKGYKMRSSYSTGPTKCKFYSFACSFYSVLKPVALWVIINVVKINLTILSKTQLRPVRGESQNGAD